MNRRIGLAWTLVLSATAVVSACGGGKKDPTPPMPPTYTIGGSIAGLTSPGLMLQVNGANNVTVAAGAATFTSSNTLASGAAYAVTVLTQPSAQTCTVASGSGTVGSANITNVAVTCTTSPTAPFTIGGTVSGLTSSGLVLQLNGANNMSVASGATTFTSSNTLTTGVAYAITVLTQPATQVCTIANGSGTVASTNVTSVAITCATPPPPTFTVGGTVSGLNTSGLVLQVNGANNLTVASGATAFTSSNALLTGAAYAVTVLTQPATQICSVASGSGTVGSANVTNVAVTCVGTYTVGVTVSGYTTSGLVLQLNGGNDLTPAASSASLQTFTPRLLNAAAYAVTILTQPATQVCTVGNGSGTVAGANVANVTVSCVNTYTVGVTLTGYTTSGLVLQLNGGNNFSPAASQVALQTFTPRLLNAAAYAVTILTQPATQVCTVGSGSGAVAGANVTNVTVSCANTYTVGVTVTGLTGSGLVLQLNGGNNIAPVAGNSALQLFAPRLLTNAAYAVTVLTQPSNPAQQCTVTNGAGTIASANITNVTVNCVALIGFSGNVSGLTGTLGLTVALSGVNAPANQSITVQPGATTFTLPVGLIDGVSFRVTVASQPAGQTCLVTRGAGVTGSTDISGITVTCAANLTSPLVGTYTLDSESGTGFTLNADGTYAMFYRAIDDGCIANNNLPFNGIEYGTYNWNSTTGLFHVLNAPVDQTGECGLNDPTEAEIYGWTLTKSGNTLSFVSNDPGDPGSAALTAVPSTTNTLLGSFATSSGGSITFLNDGTFRVVTTQARPDGADNNGTFAGLEHGCYTTTATTVTLNMSAGCQPTGRPAADTSGNAGFVFNGQSRTLNYAVTGDTLVLGTAPNTTTHARIIVNAVTPPPPPPAGTYIVSGTVTGLTSGGLLLQLNGGNDLVVASGSSGLSFSNVALSTGTPYSITVKAQPSAPTQRCTVANGSGTMGTANVTNVAINCITPTTFTISGTISGLTGTLQLGLFTSPTATETITLQPGATSYAFTTGLANGVTFGTIITSQPVGQTCIVTSSTGVIAGNDLFGTHVTCVANATSPLQGTFRGTIGTAFIAVTFEADGRFLLVQRQVDANDCRNANGQLTTNGIEYGVYNYNAITGLFRVLGAVVDTSGECGMVDDGGGAPFQATLTRNGGTLTFSFPDDNGGTTALVLIADTNTSGQLLGTYALPNGRYFTFLSDGTYIVTLPQARIPGSASNANIVGFEHGCYTSTATTISIDHTNTCVLPQAKPPIDMNGNFPLRTSAALTGSASYTLSSDTLTLYSGTPFAFQVVRIPSN